MSESQTYNFTVNITLNTENEAVFTYFQDGQQVSGGGTVNERNSLGIYTLDNATVEAGFQFTGAKFANLEGNCEQDFALKSLTMVKQLRLPIQMIIAVLRV
ncbi:DP-EP family protein [Pseudoalteromonas sp. T1lg21]|uniref:DP-EP family protein n=1 Tax=Pseudoalteromonas sp. T1lg21 TaxID=2077095 RepID=UPI001F3A02DB|nr:DP-EP family protein [Pseudoalteromonas sp. T1lg21]